MAKIDVLAAVLVVVGALNWSLVGLAGLYKGLAWKRVQCRWHSQPVLQSNR